MDSEVSRLGFGAILSRSRCRASSPAWDKVEAIVSAGARITRPPATAGPEIVALYEYWQSKAPGEGLLPGRSHIDPVDIPRLLQYVWLLDVVDDPRRFRVRLVGGALILSGTPARAGDFMADFMPQNKRAASLAELEAVVQSRQPWWHRGSVILHRDRYASEVERLVLPLASDGRTVDMLFGITVTRRAGDTPMRR